MTTGCLRCCPSSRQQEFGSSWLDAGSLTQNSGSYFASFERYSGRDWTNGWPNNYIFSASNTTVSCVFAAPSLATCSVTDLYTNEPVGGASVDTYTVRKASLLLLAFLGICS